MAFIRYLEKEEGFTLVEVMVAITVLTVALVPMMGFFTQSIKTTADAKTKSEALSLARWAVETVKVSANRVSNDGDSDFGSNEIIDKVVNAEGIDAFNPNDPNDEVTITELDGNSDFNINIKLSDYNIGDPGLQKVEVTVSWNGGSQDIELTTLIAERS